MQSTLLAWAREFPASVTVCDRRGIILEMNDRAARTFAGDGGRDLIGSSVYDCHPEPARSKLERLMDAGTTNVYTIEKHGVRKLIYQSPWFQDGQYAGFVEISFEIPRDMPHLMSG